MNDLMVEMTEQVALQKQLLVTLEMLTYLHAEASVSGWTPSMESHFGRQLASIGINTASEGLLDSIADTAIGISRKITGIGAWFEDKYKSWFDAHYRGVRNLHNWLKDGHTIVNQADPVRVAKTEVAVWDRKTFHVYLNILKEFSAKVEHLLSNVQNDISHDLTTLVTPLGYTVTKVDSKAANTSFPKLVKVNGFPDGGKDTVVNKGWDKTNIFQDAQETMRILDDNPHWSNVYSKISAAYSQEAKRLESAMAKQEDKEGIIDLKQRLSKYSYMTELATECSTIQYKLAGSIVTQMVKLCHAFGHPDDVVNTTANTTAQPSTENLLNDAKNIDRDRPVFFFRNSEVSDGHHTFRDLYAHRNALVLNLMKENKSLSWFSKYHHDGSSFDKMFICGIELPTGSITYHLYNTLWQKAVDTGAKELEIAPKWDGHTPDDVILRLITNIKQ